MINKLFKQYYLISDELKQEENEELDDLISSFGAILISKQEPTGASAGTGKDPADANLKHSKAEFSLLCYRIAVNCRLVHHGCFNFQEQLQPDIMKVVEKAKSIEYKWKIDDAAGDALDVMLAFCPECEDILKMLFENRYCVFHQPCGEVTPDLYYLFSITARYYRQLGWIEQAAVLWERLCLLSRERNSTQRHMELVAKVFGKMEEDMPEMVCRIAAADAEIFESVVNEYAGDFFWFYACALFKMEKRKMAAKYYWKSYQIRRVIYGEDSWYTAIAKREYNAIAFVLSGRESERKELFLFIDHIENGLYEGIDEDLLTVMEGKTLYIVLAGEPAAIKKIPGVYTYLDIYGKICDQYNDTAEPLLKKRIAENLWGRYWFEMCDYMQAEEAFLNALDADALQDTPDVVTLAQIKSNLLMTYYMQNDMEMAYPLSLKLFELIDEGELDKKDIYRIYAVVLSIQTQYMIKLDPEETEKLKDRIWNICKDVQENRSDLSGYAKELVVFLLCAIMQIIQNECASLEEQKVYLTVLGRIEKNKILFALDTGKQLLLYLVMEFLAWNQNLSAAEIYLNHCIELVDDEIVPKDTKASVWQTAGEYWGKQGKYDWSIACIDHALMELTSIWQFYVRYLNDTRLIQILSPIQGLFANCYAVYRKYEEIENAYEKVLQFKALASLAGRERNRILHGGHLDKELLERIRIQQDKIAALGAEHILRDTADECREEEKKLRHLETEFACQFSGINSFTDISLEKVKRAVPDHAVVVEYFLCALDYRRRHLQEQMDKSYLGIDIYITYNRNHQCNIKRVTVSDGQAVLDDVSEFVHILQAESEGSAGIGQIYDKDDIRIRLYQKLVVPVLPYIQDAELLYIAPDNELVNLPFGILSGKEGKRLGDAYSLIKIECARDFLFRQPGCQAERENLIIGNPQYEINEAKLGNVKNEKTKRRRASIREVGDIAQLPFSELEVKLIGRRSRSRYYSGTDATKSLLLSAGEYKNIHIATHGYFNLAGEEKTLYSSCLLFSGVKNWLKTGEISEIYGNGVLTADEVSRLDLRAVELAVLSSCLTGMSDVFADKGFHGMVGALSAAGVHYVISHLWSADDFATAVLMDVFYYLYLEKGQNPPAALRLAQNYLRDVTIGDLRKRKWFAYIRKYMPDPYSRKLVQDYESCNGQFRPFRSEAYWGGFSCCQCN